MPELKPGETFAGHRIQGVAGRGGMGVVYRAIQLDLDRVVALKLIAPQLAEDDEFRERFGRESRAAASIDHPNVIPIYYTGEQERALYIAMRYVEGSDLRTIVRAEGRLAPERAVRIANQVGAALDAAHARGIVHRDVKPANVLLGAGDHAYLTDFGLTKSVHSHTRSSAGGWVGTLGYVAPEQIRGQRVDARTDVYALGCVLYHALTGVPPYQRDSDEATLWAHLHDPPPNLAERAPGVPSAFEAVLDRALAKDPDDRFQSAGDLGRAAMAAAVGHDMPTVPERRVAVGAAAPEEADDETVVSPTDLVPTARADERQGAAPQPMRRRPWTIALAALPLLVLAGVAFAVLNGGGGGDASTGATTTGTTAATPAPAVSGHVAKSIPLGGRPNDVVVTAKNVWVLRSNSTRLAILDRATGRRLKSSPTVGDLPAAAAAGFGRLWVVNQRTPMLVSISLRSKRRVGPATPLPTTGAVVSVATGDNAIWIGLRGSPGQLVKVDPKTRAILSTIAIPDGLQDIAVGPGAVWVVSRFSNTVTRLDVQTGGQRRVPVGRQPRGIAVGAGYVWVTNSEDDTITRIDPVTLRPDPRRVGDTPYGITVAGTAVWVANQLGDSLTRIDTTSFHAVGDPVSVPSSPKAIDAGANQVWVTSAPQHVVTRVNFEPER